MTAYFYQPIAMIDRTGLQTISYRFLAQSIAAVRHECNISYDTFFLHVPGSYGNNLYNRHPGIVSIISDNYTRPSFACFRAFSRIKINIYNHSSF